MAEKERSVQPVTRMQKEPNINHSNPCGSWGCALMRFSGAFMKSVEAAGMQIPLPRILRDLRANTGWSDSAPLCTSVCTHTDTHSPAATSASLPELTGPFAELLGKWELNKSTFMEIHFVPGTSIGLFSVSLTEYRENIFLVITPFVQMLRIKVQRSYVVLVSRHTQLVSGE